MLMVEALAFDFVLARVIGAVDLAWSSSCPWSRFLFLAVGLGVLELRRSLSMETDSCSSSSTSTSSSLTSFRLRMGGNSVNSVS